MSHRVEYVKGHFYHFFNRGAHRVSIFREYENYLLVLESVKRYGGELAITVIAYCLLPNHFHLFVRQDGTSRASLLPQRVFNRYSKAYNRRFEHSGTLFEGPVKVKEVATKEHLTRLCPYIHANPVLHGIVDDVRAWPFSNYLEWIQDRPGTLVDRQFVDSHFGSPDAYEALVAEYLEGRRRLTDPADPGSW